MSSYVYVCDVLMKSGRSELVSLAGKENYSVVLSAQSGGGSRVAGSILTGNEADTADRGSLPAQNPDDKQKRNVNRPQPVNPVVLYEAINGDGDDAMSWIDRQLERLGTPLTKTPERPRTRWRPPRCSTAITASRRCPAR